MSIEHEYQIMQVIPEGCKFQPVRYYIDVPCDKELSRPELRTVELPRELANYINKLKKEVRDLRIENKWRKK